MNHLSLPSHLQNFLKIASPLAWCESAIKNFSLLLIDHAHCERKAAAFAIQLITKNPHETGLLRLLSTIAREELLHFEKMLKLLQKRRIRLQPLAPSRYSRQLHAHRAKANNQQQLIDDLLIAAIIEARSCERFFSLLPYLESHQDQEVLTFYQHLAMAEQRHFEVYLEYAQRLDRDIEGRVKEFIEIENNCIITPEPNFRFHSGPVIETKPSPGNHYPRNSA
jgi:tRNA-(ms[2]io[6]A)-hydroxylase